MEKRIRAEKALSNTPKRLMEKNFAFVFTPKKCSRVSANPCYLTKLSV
jgi:hypothetical protein